MSARRLSLLAIPLALAGCPSVTKQPPPDVVELVTFDSTRGVIPLPNDLALQATPGLPASALKELLQVFVTAGGFPSDQEVPITVTLRAVHRTADGTYEALDVEDVDATTVTSSTVAVVRVDGSAPEVIASEFGGFTKSTDAATGKLVGTLTIRRQAGSDGSRRWATSAGGGRYVVALRGGGKGIKTTTGRAIFADAAMALIAPNENLAVTENQPPGLSPDEAAALEQLRGLYANPIPWCNLPSAPYPLVAGWNPIVNTALAAGCAAPALPSVPSADAFAAVDSVFPHAELASIQTFGVDPAPRVQPLTDAAAGQMPFPSDFLIDPATNRIRDLTAAVGADAAAGLKTLDGFSTTAMILAPTTGPIDATTVTRTSVLLFKLPGPIWLDDLASALAIPDPPKAAYVSQPSAINQTVPVPGDGTLTVSTTIGLQPAVPATVPSVGSFFLPPLEERTTYLVVITDRVKDVLGHPLARSTLGHILLETTQPLYAGTAQNPTSLLPGVSGPDALGLQTLRDELTSFLAGLPTITGDSGLTKDHVVMAYTFRTQSITGKDYPTAGDPGLLQLAALPYNPDLLGAGVPLPPGAVTGSTTCYGCPSSQPIAAVYDAFGVDTISINASSPITTTNVGAIVTSKIDTLDDLSPTSGAFIAPGGTETPAVKPIDVLVVLPNNVTLNPADPTPIPLVVFHHGLPGSRAQALLDADSFAAMGWAVAAIDAPKNGDRAYCNRARDPTNPNVECVPGAYCVSLGDQAGDPAGAGPGVCRVADDPSADLAPFQKMPLFCLDASTTCLSYLLANKGVPVAGQLIGEYFLSGNFFRIRDSFRQDVIDQSQLIRVLAPLAYDNSEPIAAALKTYGVKIDPTKVYWYGESLGGIEGVLNAAANPRISRVALTSPAGGLVDAFTNAPDFAPLLAQIFAGLGIDISLIEKPPPPTDPNYANYLAQAQKYLLTLQIAKWILDPADPVNVAKHVKTAPLPNLLLGGTQAAKDVFAQAALCDAKLPNPWNLLVGANLGLDPMATPASGTGLFQWYVQSAGGAPAPTSFCPSGNRVPHGFVVSYGFDTTLTAPFAQTPLDDQAHVQSLSVKAQANATSFLSAPAAQSTLVTP